MLFSYTAFLAVTVALIFGTVIAAPMPPDQHRGVPNLNPPSLRPLLPQPLPPVPIPALQAVAQKITPPEARQEHRKTRTTYEQGLKKWEQAKELDYSPAWTEYADEQIKIAKAGIKHHQEWEKEHLKNRSKKIDASPSHARAKEGMAAADELLKIAQNILEDHRKKTTAANAQRRAKDLEIMKKMKPPPGGTK